MSPKFSPKYPTHVELSSASPIRDFDLVEDHIAGGIPLTVVVSSFGGLSEDWLARISKSEHIQLVYRPEPAQLDLPVAEPAIALPQPAGGRLRFAVLAVGIVVSATAVAMFAAFGLGI